MRYRFNDFEFDDTSLVLTLRGQATAIRHNEAKLLALLIKGRHQVFSKEDILSQVWHDKFVSEQAVFQNISHLRNLFGSHAIKTFSKRGYQWQLEVEEFTAENPPKGSPEPVNHEQPLEQTILPKANFKKNRRLIAIACLVFLAMSAMYFTNSTRQPAKELLTIGYIPFTPAQEMTPIAEHDEHIKFTKIGHLTRTEFLDAAELEYPKLATVYPRVLFGEYSVYQGVSYLDFTLKGPNDEWQGQLTAANEQQLLTRLLKHLAIPAISQLVTRPMAPEAKQATLLLAHQENTSDLIILEQLVNSYINQFQLETAMVMAEKLANLAQAQKNRQQLGNALLLQSTILITKELFDLSQQKLHLAITQFEASHDLKRQADAWVVQSRLDHKANDYSALKASLLKSAQLALAAKDKQRELHALTFLSVLAHKHLQTQDKYTYLTQAEDKMRTYALPVYHFAKVPFHHAIYADSAAAKEPHYKRVLEYTRSTPDHWVAQTSRRSLLQHYLASNRLADARELIQSLTSHNAENSLLKTLLAQAEPDQQAFMLLARRTFEQAQLAGSRDIALDVALLIVSSPVAHEDVDFYTQYITQKAPPYWRQRNSAELDRLSL